MEQLALLLCLLGTSLALDSSLNSEWQTFITTHGKPFDDSAEEELRREIWESNLWRIENHNHEARQGLHPFTMAMNKFADLTSEEFISKVGSIESPKALKERYLCPEYKPTADVRDLPKRVDWRNDGFVSRVKEQRNCSSCWAFAAVGAVEHQHYVRTGQRVELSSKHLVDCANEYGNSGCNGGWMENAYRYMMDKGIESDNTYPYMAQEDECTARPENVITHVRDCRSINEGSEIDLQEALATVGPVSVAVEASLFQFYSGGVLDYPTCSPKFESLNHAVLVVGYDYFKTIDYWIVKNTWGEDWGEGGFIKMRRNKGNQCGIATAASFPIL